MSKKISFVLGSMAGGGAERVVSNLVKYYSNKNYQIEIITLLNDHVSYDLPKEVTLTYISVENGRIISKPFKWIKGLRDNFKKNKPDIIVSFFAKINLLVLIATLSLKIPVIVSERNDPQSDNRSVIIKYLTYIFYPLSKKIVFQTNYAKSCFPNYVQKKGVVIPNPINVQFDFSKKKKLTKTIVSVGKLMQQKNHKLLISAFSLIANKFPEFKLHIYGDGELKDELNQYIKDKKLSDRVYLKGRTTDIFNVVYNADIFVLCSNYEGLSNALLEAMILETPVISTNYNGCDEIITNGVNGRLVDVGDCKGLARAIQETIRNYDQSLSMAKKAKQLVMEFELTKIGAQWDNVISELNFGR